MEAWQTIYQEYKCYMRLYWTDGQKGDPEGWYVQCTRGDGSPLSGVVGPYKTASEAAGQLLERWKEGPIFFTAWPK